MHPSAQVHHSSENCPNPPTVRDITAQHTCLDTHPGTHKLLHLACYSATYHSPDLLCILPIHPIRRRILHTFADTDYTPKPIIFPLAPKPSSAWRDARCRVSMTMNRSMLFLLSSFLSPHVCAFLPFFLSDSGHGMSCCVHLAKRISQGS